MSFLDSNQQECVLATENYNPCEFVQNSDLDICNENDMPFRYSPWYGLNDEDSLSTNWFLHIHSSFYCEGKILDSVS